MRQDVAPVDADHRVVVVEEHLILIVAEHDHDVGIDLAEGLLQLVETLLNAFVLLDEDVFVDVVSGDLGSAEASSSS